MGYRAYAEYKESGVTGLDQVPSHWTTWKATHGFSKIGSGTTPKSDNAHYYDGDMPWVTTSELREKPIFETQAKLTAQAIRDYPTLKTYSPHSLIIAMYGATIGRLGILEIEATVNQACCVFSGPEQFDTKFFYYWLWMWRPTLLALSAGGGQPNLSQDTLKQIRVPAPSVPEQQNIANFLDHKTAQIDHLSEKKQELIEKLQEQRIAITIQAITKGLDGNTAVKDSGVEWLGTIPEHWDVHQLSLLTETIQTGPFGSQLHAADYVEGGVPLINPAHLVSGDIIPDEKSAVDAQTVGRLNRHKLKPADIIMARRGEIGRCAFVEEEQAGWLCGTGSLIIRFAKGNSRFFSIVISSGGFSKNLELYAVGSTMLNLNPTIVGRMPVPVPPLAEQDQIVSYIDSATKKIDRSITKARETIERLQEYRAALITAAVTGQIDVRDWQAPKSTKESAANKEVA